MPTDAMSSPHRSSLFPLGLSRNVPDTARGHLQCLVTWLGQRGTNTAPGGTAYPGTALRATLPRGSDRSSPQLLLTREGRCWGGPRKASRRGALKVNPRNFQSPLSNTGSAGQTCRASHLSSAWPRHSRSLRRCPSASWQHWAVRDAGS